MNDLQQLRYMAEDLSPTERMPLLFLGHGSPMNAIEENIFVEGFRNVAPTLPRPKSIICISAHWYTRGTHVTAMPHPETIHDFGGFPKALYQVQYPASGNPALAVETQTLLEPATVGLDQQWGLDHGAWSVLRHFYPEADVPVIELSIDYTRPADYHFELAGRLASLRDKGVLIVGSGNLIHNLSRVNFSRINEVGYGYDWAIEARETMNHYLLEGNYRPLTDYLNLSDAVRLAVPTPDHFLPLIYILGMQQKGEPLSLFNDQLVAGSLSMTCVKIG